MTKLFGIVLLCLLLLLSISIASVHAYPECEGIEWVKQAQNNMKICFSPQYATTACKLIRAGLLYLNRIITNNPTLNQPLPQQYSYLLDILQNPQFGREKDPESKEEAPVSAFDDNRHALTVLSSLTWATYEIATRTNQYLTSGSIKIEDPQNALFNFFVTYYHLMNKNPIDLPLHCKDRMIVWSTDLCYVYCRRSSHFREFYQILKTYNQVGIETSLIKSPIKDHGLITLPPGDRSHILFGKLPFYNTESRQVENYLFVKNEEVGVCGLRDSFKHILSYFKKLRKRGAKLTRRENALPVCLTRFHDRVVDKFPTLKKQMIQLIKLRLELGVNNAHVEKKRREIFSQAKKKGGLLSRFQQMITRTALNQSKGKPKNHFTPLYLVYSFVKEMLELGDKKLAQEYLNELNNAMKDPECAALRGSWHIRSGNEVILDMPVLKRELAPFDGPDSLKYSITWSDVALDHDAERQVDCEESEPSTSTTASPSVQPQSEEDDNYDKSQDDHRDEQTPTPAPVISSPSADA